MKEYQAIYKCRFCGKYFVNEYQNVDEERWKKYKGTPSATSFHECAEGFYAAGDFITYILADDKSIKDYIDTLNNSTKDKNIENKLIMMSDDIVINDQNNGKMEG